MKWRVFRFRFALEWPTEGAKSSRYLIGLEWERGRRRHLSGNVTQRGLKGGQWHIDSWAPGPAPHFVSRWAASARIAAHSPSSPDRYSDFTRRKLTRTISLKEEGVI